MVPDRNLGPHIVDEMSRDVGDASIQARQAETAMQQHGCRGGCVTQLGYDRRLCDDVLAALIGDDLIRRLARPPQDTDTPPPDAARLQHMGGTRNQPSLKLLSYATLGDES